MLSNCRRANPVQDCCDGKSLTFYIIRLSILNFPECRDVVEVIASGLKVGFSDAVNWYSYGVDCDINEQREVV